MAGQALAGEVGNSAIEDLRLRAQQKKVQIRQLQEEYQEIRKDILKSTASGEIRRLERWTWAVVVFLIASIGLCLYLSGLWMQRPINAKSDPRLISVCIAAGTLGSSLAALRSALDRRAAGFEFSDGTPYPDEEKKQRFNRNMVPYFLARPFFGSVLGYLIYLGLAGGALPEVRNPFANVDVGLKLAFWSLLVGIFAKTLLEKLLDVFKGLFGG